MWNFTLVCLMENTVISFMIVNKLFESKEGLHDSTRLNLMILLLQSVLDVELENCIFTR